jgi:hypothetical protein
LPFHMENIWGRSAAEGLLACRTMSGWLISIGLMRQREELSGREVDEDHRDQRAREGMNRFTEGGRMSLRIQ